MKHLDWILKNAAFASGKSISAERVVQNVQKSQMVQGQILHLEDGKKMQSTNQLVLMCVFLYFPVKK